MLFVQISHFLELFFKKVSKLICFCFRFPFCSNGTNPHCPGLSPGKLHNKV